MKSSNSQDTRRAPARSLLPLAALAVLPCLAHGSQSGDAASRAGDAPTDGMVRGWPSWRGPDQDGSSRERGLPETITLDGENHLWSYPISGRGTPVAYGGRVYLLGYRGELGDLEEVLLCLDERDGTKIWEKAYRDFLSDIIYDRYAIGSPTIDPETGNVFFLSSPGVLYALDADGNELWKRSIAEEFGRLTFPNGRTGAPLVDGEFVILHVISASWGPEGPARDRFYGFDKTSGAVAWSSTPGIAPKDSSFSMPVVGYEGGHRVLYTGTGCGHVVCVDVRNGTSRWRFPLSSGGVNASGVLYGDSLIAIHGQENVDASTIGRMVSIRLGVTREPRGGELLELGQADVLWQNDLCSFTSSPVLLDHRLYLTDQTGVLSCVDPSTGRILWNRKLAPDQIHASPAGGDGKLYVPMNNGSFFVVRPTDEGPEILQELQLAGNCLGAPAICAGRVYVLTTERLYCFGTGEGRLVAVKPHGYPQRAGSVASVQIVPSDVTLRQGESVRFRVRALDENGLVAEEGFDVSEWTGAGADLIDGGVLRAPADAAPMAGMLTARAGDLAGSVRVRIVPTPPFTLDFEDARLAPHAVERDVTFAHPPGYWIGGRLKWEIREHEGGKVLRKTLDNPLFQRCTSIIGDAGMSNYTMQIDLMTEGNRRTMSNAGVVNQRYLIELKGNYQELEVSSNVDRLKVGVPYQWRAGVWYTLKTRVDLDDRGDGVVRAKVWPRSEPEPEAWTLEVPQRHAHASGAPSVYGFAPQSRFPVYVDNIIVTPNE